jgi:hypothetical protein
LGAPLIGKLRPTAADCVLCTRNPNGFAGQPDEVVLEDVIAAIKAQRNTFWALRSRENEPSGSKGDGGKSDQRQLWRSDDGNVSMWGC